MKSFLVIGLGRFGTSLACELCALGHEVMAVDLDDLIFRDEEYEVSRR